MKGSTAEWHVTIPANTTGRLELNASDAAHYKLEGISLAESKEVKAKTSGQRSGFELAAGSYTFVVETK
jgi:hypothetical protein